ncbi:unannotated protein [freshwater metagenome]|uniref:Unannotated protein n=1 Tax=freshwater metagenome TaxID=449393 RepID=A0A6J7IL22_9ZZZZ
MMTTCPSPAVYLVSLFMLATSTLNGNGSPLSAARSAQSVADPCLSKSSITTLSPRLL